MLFEYDGQSVEVTLRRNQGLFTTEPVAKAIAGPFSAQLAAPHIMEISSPTGTRTVYVARDEASIYLHCHGQTAFLTHVDRLNQSGLTGNDTGTLNSPMPGSVVDVAVQEGQQVITGDNLMTIEAMKMEHQIRAPHDGIVITIHFSAGDRVDEGAALMVIE
jgi:3-methylcrotonyl-CoA carboxylase alpha subunit